MGECGLKIFGKILGLLRCRFWSKYVGAEFIICNNYIGYLYLCGFVIMDKIKIK